MINNVISVVDAGVYTYPAKETLFRPHVRFPEYPFAELADNENHVYNAVRESIHLLGLDEKNYNTASWNPFGDIIKPGMNILIKPNLVMDRNQNENGGTDCLYTNPAVIAPVVDYCIIALKGNGKITIGDAPMQECCFDKLMKQSGLDVLVSYYKENGVNIEIVDFRELTSSVVNGVHIQTINDHAEGTVVDLGKNSEFSVCSAEQLKKIRITNYDPTILPTHHTVDKHEYYVSNYILNADVIINMPKPKTHRKGGITASLKNFVGANVRKEFLPHHTMGAVEEGGDEYDKKDTIHGIHSKLLDCKNKLSAQKEYRIAQLINLPIRLSSKIMREKNPGGYSEGSWYGNNTISKTITDLNKIVRYCDATGRMSDLPVRQMLIIGDMIVSGEKEGPVEPTPKNVGMIVAARDTVAFDECVCKLMGFDPEKIPTLLTVKNTKSKYKIATESGTAVIRSNIDVLNQCHVNDFPKNMMLNFEPTSGWKDHIEMD